METITKKRIERLVLFNNEQQKSTEWHKKRYNMITASDIAAVLDVNPHLTKKQLLIKKCIPMDTGFTTNEFTEWGDLFEPIARDFYQKMCLVSHIYETGCIPHGKYKWLGASPDGILPNGKLLEIKCPKKRKIHNTSYPYMYWIQMQIQMECCNLNSCDLLQCQFYQYDNKEEYINDVSTMNKGYIESKDIYWKLEKFTLNTIERDTKWFIKNVGILNQFWKTVLHYRKIGIDKLNMDDVQFRNVIDWSKWISATQIKNYLMNDCCIDYIELLNGIKKNDIYVEPLHHEKQKKLEEYLDESIKYGSSFIEMICNQGLKFERKTVELLNKKFIIKMVTTDDSQARSTFQFKQTVNFMKQGIPIIYHGVLHDYDNKLYGISDLLVRSDYLNQLTDMKYIEDEKVGSIFSKNFHYVLVDIKFSTLKLASDGLHLTNDGIVKASKGQLFIYNKILGNLQNYKPSCAYILGKKWRYKKNKDTFTGNGCFDRLGVIDFSNYDVEYDEKVTKALEWYNELRENFDKFSLFPPNDPRLFPNMCNRYDNPYHNVKSKLAKEIDEITSIWHCNPGNRQQAFENGVFKWSDEKCTASLLGFNGGKKEPIIQAILDINKQKDDMIRCYNFQNTHKWTTKHKLELYVDFETANLHNFENDEQMICSEDESIISIIGCGYALNGVWKFEKFTVNQINREEERRIVTNFIEMVDELSILYNTPNPRIFHWGHIEKTIYNKLRERYSNLGQSLWKELNWVNLCDIVTDEIIVFKGSLTFKLKEVANALHKNKLLDTSWSNHSKCVDGLNAMVAMLECNDIAIKNKIPLSSMTIMQDIEKYNEVDCKVMWEILLVMREKFGNYTTINSGPYTVDSVKTINLVNISSV